MMTDAEILAMPKKVANRAEVDAYYYFDAAYDVMGTIEKDMEKRIRMIPGGWRDLKLIRTKMGNLLRMLSGTFEPEKAQQIMKMGKAYA